MLVFSLFPFGADTLHRLQAVVRREAVSYTHLTLPTNSRV